MQVHSELLTVAREDLDELDHVNNVRYVEWIQEISKKHWIKATTPKIRDEVVWVVKNHDIAYHRSAKLGDVLQINTYIQDTKVPLSIRIVEIKDNKTDKLIVKACTEWCLLDARTFRPKRVPESVQKLFQDQ